MGIIRRLLPRFSLRTLVVFLLLVTAATATGFSMRRWERERTISLQGFSPWQFSAGWVYATAGWRRIVLIGFKSRITLWDGESGELMGTLLDPVPESHGLVLAWDLARKDDRPVLECTLFDKSPARHCLWSLEDGALLLEQPVTGDLGKEKTFADGQLLGARHFMWSEGAGKLGYPGYLVEREGWDEVCMSRDLVLWRRVLPDVWWRFIYQWEFWLTVAFTGLFVWSVVRDRRALALASVTPSPLVGEGGDGG